MQGGGGESSKGAWNELLGFMRERETKKEATDVKECFSNHVV